jgi:glutamate-1-semialdehyde 2,1-aminomutase
MRATASPARGEAAEPALAPPSFAASIGLNARLQAVIPGGAHTYAKGIDQYPEDMAPVIERGSGSRVWDVDGNEFIEYGSGLRAVSLGHAHPRVNAAAAKAMAGGTNFSRPARIELEAAEDLLSLLPNADMVKFTKNGSDATTAAVKLARAVTGRDRVAICRDQPFFSTDDWFIGSTPMDHGIPDRVSSLTLTFPYNDAAALEQLFADFPDEIACIVMEGATTEEPAEGYLTAVRAACTKHGVLLVLDEMITGFRWSIGGAQQVYELAPDLSTFGKALSNGFSVSALVGRREHMRLGGIDHPDRRVFLLSTTHGAESHALAAARAVIETYRSEDVIDTLYFRGEQLASGVRQAAAEAGVADHVLVSGRPSNLVFATLDADGARSQEFRTLFIAELMRRGVIAPSFVVGAAHTEADIRYTVEAVRGACDVYRKALEDGVEQHLVGRPVRPVFRSYA